MRTRRCRPPPPDHFDGEREAARLSNHEFFQSAEDYDHAMRTKMVAPTRASVLGNGVDLSRFDPGKLTKKTVGDLRKPGAQLRAGSWSEPSEGSLGKRDTSSFSKLRGGSDPTARNSYSSSWARKSPRRRTDSPPRMFRAPAMMGSCFTAKEKVEAMPAIYSAFDIFALASHREGMPRSAIEASAMARAVVATNIRGCREVVDDGKTGILTPVRDAAALAGAFESLAAAPELRASMGDTGRQRALSRFDEEQVIERTLAVYRRLLAAKGRS